MVSKPWPTVLIVGAPKSGTTSLYAWLEQHPDVFMPEKKETLYFCDIDYRFEGPDADFFNDVIPRSEEEYLDLFAQGVEHQHRGEASTDHLSCPKAAVNIHNTIPDARIIILLRNPIARAFSEHMHVVRDGFETCSFREAIEHEEERIAAHWNPLFHHRRRGMYYDQVKRYLDVFGKDNVLVSPFEELARTPEAYFAKVLDFLDLAPFTPDFDQVMNKSGRVRFRLLHEIARGHVLPQWAKTAIKSVFGKDRVEKARTRAADLNMEKLPFPEEDRAWVTDIFREDIQKLEELLGWDLKHWYGEKG